jgi:hypothetical protein
MSTNLISYAIGGNNPSTVGGAGTGLFYFSNGSSSQLWNSGTLGVAPPANSSTAGSTPSSTNYSGQLPVPAGNFVNGQRMQLIASGDVLFGAGEPSTTATIKVMLNSGIVLSPVITDLLGTSVQLSNQALDGVYYPWSVVMDFVGTNLSGILQITKSALVNGSLVASTAVNAVTGINFSNGVLGSNTVGTGPGVNNYAFGLACGIQFGASSSGNAANLYQFELNVL